MGHYYSEMVSAEEQEYENKCRIYNDREKFRKDMWLTDKQFKKLMNFIGVEHVKPVRKNEKQ